MTSVEEILQTLESLGTEQARKTYRRHGVKGPLYGVSYADQKKLAKQLKTNHPLALELWASGNHDARILGLSIADPKQATEALLNSLMSDVNDYVETDALSAYIGKTAIAREKMDEWMKSSNDWTSTIGWNVLSTLARDDQTLPDSYFESYMTTIERDLHSSKNRTRHAMNNTLIAIGIRNAALERKAFDIAARIGKVVVDHGNTDCKTPDAAAYIKKATARKLEKA